MFLVLIFSLLLVAIAENNFHRRHASMSNDKSDIPIIMVKKNSEVMYEYIFYCKLHFQFGYSSN